MTFLKYIPVIFLFFLIIITGCSSSNMLPDDKYIQKINNAAAGERVKIVSTDETEFTAENLAVRKDSTSWINIVELKTILRKSEIENVTYTEGGYNNSAIIKLKNGNIINGSRIEADNTSVSFFSLNESPIKMPTDNIKKISIKNHLSTALIGLGIGFFAGGIAGTLINIGDDRKAYTLTFPGAVVGGVIGFVTGMISGTWRDYHLR